MSGTRSSRELIPSSKQELILRVNRIAESSRKDLLVIHAALRLFVLVKGENGV